MDLEVKNRFTYESVVYSYNKNIVVIIDSAIYESDSFVDGIVGSYFITKNIEICTELIGAPLQYINKLNK